MKKKTVTAAVFILALAILVGGGVWQWKKMQRNNRLEQQQRTAETITQEGENQTEQKVADTNNWKTYVDKKYGFEIKYDPDWGIRNIGVAERGEEEVLYITINGDGTPAQAWEMAFNKGPKAWWSGKNFMSAKSEVIEEKDYSINGNSTYYVKIIRNGALENYYVVSNGKSIVCFYFLETTEVINSNDGKIEKNDFSEYLPKFEAMVNSIRFID